MQHQFPHTFSQSRFNKRVCTSVMLASVVLWATSVGGGSKAADPLEADETPSYPSTLTGGAPCGSCVAPAGLSWRTVIPPRSEPGEPLVISGIIYQPDGFTPAEGMFLFVFHTDVTGYYNKDDDASHPRLKGWMKIGADGGYEFRTIKPGAYPHRSTPAHIHAHVYGPGYSERSIDDYWFEGDPRINSKERAHAIEQGGNPVIVALQRDGGGVLRGRRDIKLKPAK